LRYEFIRAEKAEYPVSVLCRTMRVSRSGFYAFCAATESVRAAVDRRLAQKILEVFMAYDATYGSPRVHRELRDEWGWRVGRKRVSRLMRQEGLCARRKRRFRCTTDSRHDDPIAPNLLQRNFQVSGPNRVWLSDVTYIPTREGWLYLAVVLDLWSRRIVGWSMSAALNSQLTCDALLMAVEQRRPSGPWILHSDRGKEYTANRFRRLLADRGGIASMSRKGDCWDNAPAESFFSTLKGERVSRRRYNNRIDARADLFSYIELFYNLRRRHSSIDYQSPATMEAAAA